MCVPSLRLKHPDLSRAAIRSQGLRLAAVLQSGDISILQVGHPWEYIAQRHL